MRNQISIVIIATILGLLLMSSMVPSRAQETAPFKVIVNQENPHSSVERAELAKLFLKKKSRWSHGVTAMPIDQKLTSEIRRKFSEIILRKPVSAVNAYWQQRIFSGRGIPPPQKSSDSAVVLYVAANPGAVGYVSGTTSLGKTKVLKVDP